MGLLSERDRRGILLAAGGSVILDGREIAGLFRDEAVEEISNDTRLAYRRITALVSTRDADEAVERSSVLEVDGKRYVVQDIDNDGTGMTTLTLTASQP